MTTDLDALVAFLRARLDEQEAAANAATQGEWSAHGRWVWATGRPDAVFGVDGDPADAQYIARHNPAQVLREVDAHRRIVDACMPHVIRADDCGQLARGALFALTLPHSSHPDYREEWRPDA